MPTTPDTETSQTTETVHTGHLPVWPPFLAAGYWPRRSPV